MIKNKNLKKITTQLLKANILSVSIVFGAFAQGYPAQESFLPIELNNTLSSTPVIFHIEGSNKIVLDLFNANGIIKNYPSILPHDPFVSKIDSREIGDRVRVVFDMKQPVKYKAVNTNGKLNLVFTPNKEYVNVTSVVNTPHDLANKPKESSIVADIPERKIIVNYEQRSSLTGMSESEKQKIIDRVLNANAIAPVVPVAQVTTVPVTKTVSVSGDTKIETNTVPVVAQIVPARQLEKLNFKKDGTRAGRLTLEFSDSSTTPKIERSGDSLIIDLKGVAISKEMQRRLSTKGLSVATQSIDVLMQQENGKIVLEQSGDWDFTVFQLNNKLTLDIRNLSEYESYLKSQQGKDSYNGKPLSINFQNMDVRSILQVISDFSKVNILTSDAVTGNMTVRLQDIPWDQALDLILDARNLQKVKQGNVIWIATREEVTKKNEEIIKQKEQSAKLEPLKLEAFQLNHHKAEDVIEIIKGSNTSPSGGGAALSILSPNGTVSVDKRNNMIFVQDIPSRLEEVRKLLKRIDITTRQVLIESKIVIADSKWGKEIGAKIGLGAQGTSGRYSMGIGGNSTNSYDNARGGADTVAGALNVTPSPLFAAAAAAGSGSLGFTLLNLASGAALNLELSALENNNRGKVLSNPRLLTTDNKKAVLEQGTEIPYVTPGSANSPPTVAFKKAVLSLGVVPQISPNGRIIMNLQVRKDTIGELVNVQGGGQIPSIDTRNIDTQVTVNNGQTVVLGGVYELSSRQDAQKVPFLGDIPVLGNLFKHNVNSEQKAELLIFITPYVVEDEDLDRINNPDAIDEITLTKK